MPGSALLSRQPLEKQTNPGLDLVVVMPGRPGRVLDVVMDVVAGARKRGWRVLTVPLIELVSERAAPQGNFRADEPSTRRR